MKSVTRVTVALGEIFWIEVYKKKSAGGIRDSAISAGRYFLVPGGPAQRRPAWAHPPGCIPCKVYAEGTPMAEQSHADQSHLLRRPPINFHLYAGRQICTPMAVNLTTTNLNLRAALQQMIFYRGGSTHVHDRLN